MILMSLMRMWHFREAGGMVMFWIHEFKFLVKAVRIKQKIHMLTEVTSRVSNPPAKQHVIICLLIMAKSFLVLYLLCIQICVTSEKEHDGFIKVYSGKKKGFVPIDILENIWFQQPTCCSRNSLLAMPVCLISHCVNPDGLSCRCSGKLWENCNYKKKKTFRLPQQQ